MIFLTVFDYVPFYVPAIMFPFDNRAQKFINFLEKYRAKICTAAAKSNALSLTTFKAQNDVLHYKKSLKLNFYFIIIINNGINFCILQRK